MEQNPWRTPFGRLIIVSAVLAAVIGFSMAAGVTSYFRTAGASDEANVGEELVSLNSWDMAPPDAAPPEEAVAPTYQDANVGDSEASTQSQYYIDRNEGDDSATYRESASAEQTTDQPSDQSDTNSGDQE